MTTGILSGPDRTLAAQKVAQSLATAKTQPATTPAKSATAAGPAITSSDFLTLLVAELKNQDPTQPTDPNAYIQQLVGVNSLQQLISINQNLTSTHTAPVASTP